MPSIQLVRGRRNRQARVISCPPTGRARWRRGRGRGLAGPSITYHTTRPRHHDTLRDILLTQRALDVSGSAALPRRVFPVIVRRVGTENAHTLSLMPFSREGNTVRCDTAFFCQRVALEVARGSVVSKDVKSAHFGTARTHCALLRPRFRVWHGPVNQACGLDACGGRETAPCGAQRESRKHAKRQLAREHGAARLLPCWPDRPGLKARRAGPLYRARSRADVPRRARGGRQSLCTVAGLGGLLSGRARPPPRCRAAL